MSSEIQMICVSSGGSTVKVLFSPLVRWVFFKTAPELFLKRTFLGFQVLPQGGSRENLLSSEYDDNLK
jgi:hypothetical protein